MHSHRKISFGRQFKSDVPRTLSQQQLCPTKFTLTNVAVFLWNYLIVIHMCILFFYFALRQGRKFRRKQNATELRGKPAFRYGQIKYARTQTHRRIVLVRVYCIKDIVRLSKMMNVSQFTAVIRWITSEWQFTKPGVAFQEKFYAVRIQYFRTECLITYLLVRWIRFMNLYWIYENYFDLSNWILTLLGITCLFFILFLNVINIYFTKMYINIEIIYFLVRRVRLINIFRILFFNYTEDFEVYYFSNTLTEFWHIF